MVSKSCQNSWMILMGVALVFGFSLANFFRTRPDTEAWAKESKGAVTALPSFAPVSNPGTLTIDAPHTYSQVFAVSDVHGMLIPVLKLLRENKVVDANSKWSAGKSLLVIVGDSIDKGPDSLGVLDLWIRLSDEAAKVGGKVIHLLGNHEAEFLANPSPTNIKAREFLNELSLKGVLVNTLLDPKDPRGKFLRTMPVAVRVGRWLFCHSGFLPELTWKELTTRTSELLTRGDYMDPVFQSKSSILQAKAWWRPGSRKRETLLKRLNAAGLNGVVFGHQPRGLDVAFRMARSTDGRLIKIDHGMSPEAGAHAGGILMFPEPSALAAADATKATAFALVSGKREEIVREGAAGR